MINAFAKVQSLMGGIILGVFLLGILSKRASSSGVIVASVLGLAAVLYVFVFTFDFTLLVLRHRLPHDAAGWMVVELDQAL